MAKYGFDYLTQRTEVLTEMARTTKKYDNLSDGCDECEYKYNFVDLRTKVLNSIKSGKAPNTGEPLVNENGDTATGIFDGAQYRTLLYMFSMVYNTSLDAEENVDYTSDIEFENAKALLASDISALPIHDSVYTILYEIQDYINQNKIQLDENNLIEIIRQLIKNKIPNIEELIKAKDKDKDQDEDEDEDEGDIDDVAVFLIDIYRNPLRFLSSIFEIHNVKTTTGKTKEFGEGSATDSYQKKLASISKSIVAKNHPNPKSIKPGPDKVEAATIILIKQHLPLIYSKEFVGNVLDPVNIANFMTIGQGTVQLTHHSSKIAANVREEQYGLSVRAYNELISISRPIRTQLSYLQRAEAKKKPSTVSVETTIPKESQSKNEIANMYTENIDNILIVLLQMKHYKTTIDDLVQNNMERFNGDYEESIDVIHDDYPNMPVSVIKSISKLNGTKMIDRLYTSFLQMEDTGISLEDFNSSMETVKQNSPTTAGFVDFFVNEVNSKINIFGLRPSESSKNYPGFKQEHIKRVIDTPKKKNIFDLYYNKIYVKDLKRRVDELQQQIDVSLGKEVVGKPITSYAMKAALKNFEQKGSRAEDMERERKAAERARWEAANKQSNKVGKEVQDIIGKAPKNESYVMEYMIEQISKDKFKPKGEFKDRGFIKPTNYWQGRTKI